MSDLSMQIFNFLSNFNEFCVVVPELLSFIGICLFLGYSVFAAGRVRSSILVQDNLVACRVFNFILFGVFYWVVLLLFVNIAAPSIFLFEGSFLFSEAGFYVNLWIIISFYVVSNIFVFPVWGGRLNTYEVILIFMFMLFFSFLVINSFDLFILFLNFEGLSFCFYVLLMLGPRIFISIEAALNYFCLSGLTGSIFLYGISILYGLFGDVGFICLSLHFADSSLGVVRFLNVGLFNFALACVFFGFFFKLSIFPCHLWTPDVYAGGSLMVVALFAMISKGVALFVFIEFLLVVCSPIIAVWQSGVFLCGLLSVVCGVFGALKQTNLLRFMGYTSVVNFGFILLGLGCMSFIGVASAILNFFVYTLTFFYFLVLLNQFSLVGDSVSTVEYLHQLRGLTRGSYYFLVCCLTVVFFSMAGFPPFAGFFGNYFLLVSLIEAGFGNVAFCLIFLNILGFFYYARLVNLLWFSADVNLVGGGGVFNLVNSSGVFVDVLFVVGFLFLVGFFCSLVGVVTGVSSFTQCLFIGLW